MEPTPEERREERVEELDADPIKLTLSFSGDLLMHAPVYLRAQALAGGEGYDFAPLFAEIRPYVEKPDLAFCHIETPMTPAAPASYPVFNTPPSLADGIAKTGWDACSTASNHTLDQGEAGVAETLKALDAAGIEHTGSATSVKERDRPLILKSHRIRIAYLAYTGSTNGFPVPEPYLVNLMNPERIAEDAQRAVKRGADAVIVNLHWGADVAPEYVSKPGPDQVHLMRKIAGIPEVTSVVGQGPHVPQPIDTVGGKVVVYSEGNLVSNQGSDTGLAAASQDGYIFLLELTANGTRTRVSGARYVPTWTDHADYRVIPSGAPPGSVEADAAALQASYTRTVDVAGTGAATPEPKQLP